MTLRPRQIALLVFLAFAAALLWMAPRFVLLTFSGVLVAAMLHGLAGALARVTPLGRRSSLAAAIALLVLFLACFAWWTAPRLASQGQEVAEKIGSAVETLQEELNESAWGRFLLEQMPALEELVAGPRQAVARLFGTVGAVWQALVAAVYVVFLGLFLAIHPRLYQAGIVALLPPKKRSRAWEVTAQLGFVLQRWLLSRVVQMIAIGIATAIGLWLLGVPHAFTLALLAGLFVFIPLVGAVLAAVPAILIGFLEGPSQALYVTLLYLLIQQLEGNLLMPLVERRFLYLPPALTLAALFVMGSFFGFLGVLVATPLTAVVLVLVKMLYLEDTLGDEVTIPGGESGDRPAGAG